MHDIPHQHLKSGLAIRSHETQDQMTLSCLIRKAEGGYVGVTSGHLTRKTLVSRDITQPNVKYLKRAFMKLKKEKREREEERDGAANPLQRAVATLGLGNVEQKLALMTSWIGNTSEETHTKLRAGSIIDREFKVVKVDDRHCISDYLLFDVIMEREPVEGEGWTFKRPTDGELGKVNWKTVHGWGAVQLDDMVRKNGAISEFTFGFITGVHLSWQSPSFSKVVDEYYVLEEGDVDRHEFAQRGDSGAGLVTSEGRLVGFVMAQARANDFTVVVHPVNKIPDLKRIKERRRRIEVNLDGAVWFESFPALDMTLVTCASVLEKRCQLSSIGDLHIVCRRIKIHQMQILHSFPSLIVSYFLVHILSALEIVSCP